MPLVSPYLETTNINVNELKSLIKSHIEWLDRLKEKRKKNNMLPTRDKRLLQF